MLNKKYNVNSLMLGKAGEYRVAAELVLRGHSIYLPAIDNGVDIIIDDGIRIQIKCGQRHMASKYQKHKNITYNFNVRSCKYSRYSHKILEPHPLEGVDFVICWAIDDGEFYIIPADKVRGQTTIKVTADMDRRTKVKWNQWLPYRNAWEQLDGIPIEDIKEKTELECVNCGYQWLPLTEHPSRCPNCNKHWDTKMYNHICKRCGNDWHSNLEHPNWCPKCNSKVWDKEKEPNDRKPITCVDCGYTWQPLTDNPERCPKCKTRRYLGGSYKECKVCGNVWFSTARVARKCPFCESTKWRLGENKPIENCVP